MVKLFAHRYGTHGTTFSMRFWSKAIQQALRSCPIFALHWSNFESTFGRLPPSACEAACHSGRTPHFFACASLMPKKCGVLPEWQAASQADGTPHFFACASLMPTSG